MRGRDNRASKHPTVSGKVLYVMILNMKVKFALIALPLLTLSFVALAQTSATSTDMVAIPGTADSLPAGVQDLGPVATNTPEQVLLGLQQTAQQKAAEQEFLNELTDRSSPNFHQFLTPQEWNARFGAPSQEVAAVTQWLSSAGFTNITLLKAGASSLQFSGTAGQIESAFDISINNYLVKGKECQASPDNQSVPANIASFVVGFSISDCFPPTAEAGPGAVQGITGATTGTSTATPTALVAPTTVATGTVVVENSNAKTSNLPLIVGGAIVLVIILAIAAVYFFH